MAKKVGHQAHTQDADAQEGLAGKILRRIHIGFLGAGSGFCPALSQAICTPREIKAMALEMFEAEVEYLPGDK